MTVRPARAAVLPHWIPLRQEPHFSSRGSRRPREALGGPERPSEASLACLRGPIVSPRSAEPPTTRARAAVSHQWLPPRLAGRRRAARLRSPVSASMPRTYRAPATLILFTVRYASSPSARIARTLSPCSPSLRSTRSGSAAREKSCKNRKDGRPQKVRRWRARRVEHAQRALRHGGPPSSRRRGGGARRGGRARGSRRAARGCGSARAAGGGAPRVCRGRAQRGRRPPPSASLRRPG